MALLGFERGPADMGWTARLRRMLTLAESSVRDGRVSADAGAAERWPMPGWSWKPCGCRCYAAPAAVSTAALPDRKARSTSCS